MRKALTAILAASLLAGPAPSAMAVLRGPYATDANTLILYHFDEAPGAADPGNPIVNHGGGGSALDLTDTGGPDGRDNTGGGGYASQAYGSPFGVSFHVRNSGDGSYYSLTGGNTAKGGLRTAGAVTQASLQGANGAFTYEALVTLSSATSEQEILAHDGTTVPTRGFLFRVRNGNLALFRGVEGASDLAATIPTTGDHAFVANAWYHVAVTYNGSDNTANNLKFYWTKMGEGPGEANLIGTAMLPSDLSNGSDVNRLGAGTTTRTVYRFQPVQLDEIRISNIARAPGDMLFSYPTTTIISVW